MRSVQCFLVLICMLFVSAPAYSAPAADAVVGVWLDADKRGYVEIYRAGDVYQGRVAGSTDGVVKNDVKNPVSEKRKKTLLGQDIIKGLTFNGQGHWQGGTIYNPDDGNTYSVRLTIIDANTLDLHGYLGVPLFGMTQRWTRSTEMSARASGGGDR
ncbi:DUF2147 domain-containing protein [Stenotrophobium rhamnosiphilum]|uniref:DUF2147 domain-containing protein n=2 Tax=Stenotrophobium rhamnosiphilum TaxID=2029166 RepID=A0A2T5MBA0_9GAMM|nr:DUF2147 domain-containing protein [Stenotrophobium rhamnosiphilum]